MKSLKKTRAFGSKARIEQVRRRIIAAITGKNGITPSTGNAMVKARPTRIEIDATSEQVGLIKNALNMIETRGVEIRLNGREIACAPTREDHIAARSMRASKPPPEPRATRDVSTASASA